jgi:predicted enzyme related to lactoylglutathione lyase
MTAPEGPLFRHGKLSYIQIPALDAQVSSAFYAAVFGWTIGGSPDHVSFQDTSGELIGAFVTNLAIANEPGILPYIYVQGLDATIERVEASGGQVVKPPYPEGDLWVATFRDPAGNILGLWQSGAR